MTGRNIRSSFHREAFFAARGLAGPDGRAMHLYRCDDAEFSEAGFLLSNQISSGAVEDYTAQWFVLWASERIRRFYAEGGLSWEFVFDGLGRMPDRTTAVTLTERGLKLWKRQLRWNPQRSSRLFLYSLMAEGGLPDALLAKGSGYSSAVLGAISDIEVMGNADVLAIARRWLGGLPSIFQNDDTAMLLAELAQAIVELRSVVPEGIAGTAVEAWLNVNRPSWAASLPLRLSEAARLAILRPALSDRSERPSSVGALSQRLLRRRADGKGWAGSIRIRDGMIIPFSTLPTGVEQKTLRLVSETGPVFRAVPDTAGWRVSGPRPLTVLALDPDRSCMMTAHADGAQVGEMVIDLGLPSTDEAVSLWRLDPNGGSEENLVPASSSRTRGDKLWLLAPLDLLPHVSEGLEIGAPDAAPGGQLWALSGAGNVRCGQSNLQIETASEAYESDEAMLLPLASLFSAWGSDDGLSVFSGDIRFLGIQGAMPGKDVTRQSHWRSMRRILGGQIVEWHSEYGEIRASVGLVHLPAALSAKIREIEAGLAVIIVSGLPEGWIASATAAGLKAHAEKLNGGCRIVLDARKCLPATVVLSFSEPKSGKTLRLSAPWPSRDPFLISPEGERLLDNRVISLPKLMGWRGMLPASGGALQLQLAARSKAIGFGTGGMQRLSAWTGLVSQAMALAGADGRLNLRLVKGGETPRLEIGAYDWDAQLRGDLLPLGAGTVTLKAITLSEPFVHRETEAKGPFDLSHWLGDVAQLWFIQGRDEKGVMRSVAWSSRKARRTNRPQRIAGYQEEFRAMLVEVDHPGWGRLIQLIRLAQQAGACGALDQVQALPGVPAIAIVLLFRMKPEEVASTLDLEGGSPFWWPLISVKEWSQALQYVRSYQMRMLSQAGIIGQDAEASVETGILRRVATILLHRPELKAHFGFALLTLGLPVVVTLATGVTPLLVSNPGVRLVEAARQLAARAPEIPHGVGDLKVQKIDIPVGFSDSLRPILDAPLMVAEIATEPSLITEPQKILQFLALRHADPAWFDVALPLALQIANLKDDR
ncbi:STY4851/ECs_5259 family protein [Pseudotabrizicola alkalilacus]|nr:STY4851/ECs_5259 family protein [Pseudotabrizicola alkalilacus]